MTLFIIILWGRTGGRGPGGLGVEGKWAGSDGGGGGGDLNFGRGYPKKRK